MLKFVIILHLVDNIEAKKCSLKNHNHIETSTKLHLRELRVLLNSLKVKSYIFFPQQTF